MADEEMEFEQGASGTDDSIYSNLNNFVIDKKIGKGQFSEVYRARCRHNGSIVALKKVQVSITTVDTFKVSEIWTDCFFVPWNLLF